MWLTIGAGGCRNELLASPLPGPLAQLSFVLESVPLAGLSFVLECSTNDTLHILVNLKPSPALKATVTYSVLGLAYDHILGYCGLSAALRHIHNQAIATHYSQLTT